MTEKLLVEDVLGRKLKVGDYVFYYQNIYEIKEMKGDADTRFRGYNPPQQVKLFLVNPSPSSKAHWRDSRETCLLPEKDVTMWLLRRSK